MSTLLDAPPPPRHREFTRWLKSMLAVLVSLAVLIGGATFVGVKGYNAYMSFRTAEDYIGSGKAPAEVTIPKGATLADIADLLVERDVVRSAKAFEKAAVDNEKSRSIQPGKYQLRTQLPAASALAMLLDPANQIRRRVTIIEGLRLTAQVKVLAERTKIPEKRFAAALRKPGTLGLPGWAKNRPEGFLFPATYDIADDATAQGIVRQMTRQFTSVTEDINFTGRAKDLGRSPYQALIIASLIEGEVHHAEDQDKVARVIYNRLAKGMKLELDSTVHYAVGKDASVFTTNEDRASTSAYNTYKVKGLPPGPINAPGRAALDAAVSPGKGTWLYFTTVNLDTGETRFENTLKEHQANEKVLRDWCAAHPDRGC